MSAQLFAGFSQGAAKLASDLSNQPLREAREQQALDMQKQSSMELKEFEQNAPNRAREAEIRMEGLEMQLAGQQRQELQNNTTSTIKRYLATGDTKIWNNFLASQKNNPMAQKLYGDTNGVYPLKRDPENDEALRQLGFMDPEAIYNDPELSKNFIVVDKADGPTVMPVDSFIAGTGTRQFLEEEELTNLERNARVQAALRQGDSKQKVDMKEQVFNSLIQDGMSKSEAYKALMQMEQTGKGTNVLTTEEERAVALIQEEKNVDYITAVGMYYKAKSGPAKTSADERIIKYIAEQRFDGDIADATEFYYSHENPVKLTDTDKNIKRLMKENPDMTEAEALEESKNLTRTTKQKNLESVDEYKDELDNMNFFEMDVANMPIQEKSKVHRTVQKIEQSLGIEYSSEEKKTMRNLRSLTSLGNVVGEKLSSTQVGLWDNMLSGVSKYTIDNAGGKEAKAAYETFRNILRNELFGAAQSAQETKNFNKAMGSANEQLKPMLAGFKVQLQTIKSKLQSIADSGDPYLAHYYLGGDLTDVDAVIGRLERRIGLMDSAGKRTDGKGPTITVKPRTQSEQVQTQSTVTPPQQDSATPPAFDFKAALKKEGR